MTQDRIPLDAGSSRPAMEGETNELDARGLLYAETAVHFAGDDADAKALAEAAIRAYRKHAALPSDPAAGGEVMWPFVRKQTPRNVDFWQLPRFWQGYIEGQDEMLTTYSDDISTLRAENEQLRRERDAIRNETLEEAAKVAESDLRTQTAIDCGYIPNWLHHARRIAAAIRNLKEPSDEH